jgi:hypothetical protein
MCQGSCPELARNRKDLVLYFNSAQSAGEQASKLRCRCWLGNNCRPGYMMVIRQYKYA